MDTRILSVFVFTIILGGTVGFGFSYLMFNDQIQNLQNELNVTSLDVSDVQAELDETESNLSNVNATLHDLPTEWTLYDLASLNDTVLGFDDELASILAYLDAINASMTGFGTDLSNVNSTVSSLSDELAFYANQSQWIPQPSFDSGWIDITNKTGQYYEITHNLNTTNTIIEIEGKADLDGGSHKRNLGGTSYPDWTNIYDISQYTVKAESIVHTLDGGIAIAGYLGTRDFSTEYFLVKYSVTGNTVFDQQYGGIDSDDCFAMIQTDDGGYMLAGRTRSFGAGDFDAWLVKTDANGNMEWNQTYGGSDWDAARSVVQTADGGYAIAGSTNSVNDFWLLKINATGSVEWSQTYGTVADEDAWRLVYTLDGGYLIAGPVDDNLWLVKTNATGMMEWNQTYEGMRWNRAKYGQGHVGTLIQTHDEGFAIVGQTGPIQGAESDAWLIKTDVNGVHQWNQTYGTISTIYPEGASSVVQTPDRGYMIVGWQQSDIWFVKTSANGIQEQSERYAMLGDEGALHVIQTSNGGFGVIGYDGNEDVIIIKTLAESGLAWTGSTEDTITLYRGSNDPYWNYVRVRIWKLRETS